MNIEPIIIDQDFGINVTIHIACCEEEEILTHLSVLRSQIKKSMKKKSAKGAISLELASGVTQTFTDNNCYGTHDAVIHYSE